MNKMKIWGFAIKVNDKLYTETIEALTFRRAINRLPSRYKSFKSLTYVTSSEHASEVIMSLADYVEIHNEIEKTAENYKTVSDAQLDWDNESDESKNR